MSSWSSEVLPLDSVFEYYSVQRDALTHFRIAVLNAFASDKKSPHLLKEGVGGDPTTHSFDRFSSLTRDEIFELFVGYGLELERSAFFFMVATVEAEVRLHFQKKRSRKREFRALRARSGKSRVRLINILDAWALQSDEAQKCVSQFKSALRVRHWLAHGRSWQVNNVIKYSPEDIYDIGLRFRKILIE